MPEGWNNWSKPEAEINSYYGEYNCNGEGAKTEKRVAWSHQLKRPEANKFKNETILGAEFAKAIKDLNQN